MSLSILDVIPPKKKKHDSLKAEKSTSSTKNKPKYEKADTETDSENEKNTLITKRPKSEKRPWTEVEKPMKNKYEMDSSDSDDSTSTKKKKLSLKNEEKTQYDIVLMDDFNSLKDIPPKSVYISNGLAVEIKKFQKKVYVSFSKTEIEETGNKGLAVSIAFRCTACSNMTSAMSSKISRNKYDVNIRLVYGMRCIGKGKKSAEVLCAMMDLPPPPQQFASFQDILYDGLDAVSTSSMKNATEETIASAGGDRDIAAAFDGSWQKRGHTSLNGIVVCTSLENGKVMDFECVTKYCSKCVNNPTLDHNCDKNYSGSSGGMEVAGVLKLFQRSDSERQVRYLDYLGDGDCKAYDKVVETNVYGPDTKVNKLECVAHIQKRMGTRLRKLKVLLNKKKLSDGKFISGRGRLTDQQINLIQSYYGLAIRRSVNKPVKDMVRGVWAIYFHKLSTDEHPQHGLCPTEKDTWCKYNAAKLSKNPSYVHKNALPEPVLLAMKPIFKALSDPKLLIKCTHGKTQNVNESFNKCVWDRLPKTSFNGLKSIKVGVMDAVICFNDGAQKRIEVLKHMGIEPGFYMSQALRRIDNQRIREANLASKGASKEARKAKQIKKRKVEIRTKQDTSDYEAGGF